MSNPTILNATQALETRLANNMPAGFSVPNIHWIGVGNFKKPDSANYGRTTMISFDDVTYAGQWSRFTGLYVIDLFFVLPTNGSIMNGISQAIDDLTASFTNQYFSDVTTYNITKNNIESADSTHTGRQININFSYEGRI